MTHEAGDKSLHRRIAEYCAQNYAAYEVSANQDFDKAVIRGLVGLLFAGGSTLVAIACYLSMHETWLLFSHLTSSLFLLSGWLIFPLLPQGKRPAILWFDITLGIMLVEIYFIIGAYWRLNPKALSEINTLGFDLFIYLCLSAHPSKRYRITRDLLFVAGNFLVVIAHNPAFFERFSDVIDFLRFASIYALCGVAIASLVNFYSRFRFYFDFVSRSAKIHAYQQMAKLLYRHQIEAIEGGLTLEETMPIGTGKAAVISFDVQNSGALGHNKAHDFFESVNKKSYELMIQNYRGEQRISDAFLIKEMGDGFLCSVGFPFSSPGDIHEQAVNLAERFIQLFKSEAQRYFPGQRVLCCVGIAFGDVTGKFPSIGVRSYELFGDAIVKATRYESMRKILFQEFSVNPGHIMILQNEVFQALPALMQKNFQKVDLAQFRVRDDPFATHLYYSIDRSSLLSNDHPGNSESGKMAGAS